MRLRWEDRRAAENRTGDWQRAEQESDRTEKQTGRLQDSGLTGAELQSDSRQETGGERTGGWNGQNIYRTVKLNKTISPFTLGLFTQICKDDDIVQDWYWTLFVRTYYLWDAFFFEFRNCLQFLVINPWRFSVNLPYINLLKPTDHVMHQQFNIQQLYALPTLYLCVLYLSENKRRLVSLTA